jgi:hypothetical protein
MPRLLQVEPSEEDYRDSRKEAPHILEKQSLLLATKLKTKNVCGRQLVQNGMSGHRNEAYQRRAGTDAEV